jgi:hypothetical protein
MLRRLDLIKNWTPNGHIRHIQTCIRGFRHTDIPLRMIPSIIILLLLDQ